MLLMEELLRFCPLIASLWRKLSSERNGTLGIDALWKFKDVAILNQQMRQEGYRVICLVVLGFEELTDSNVHLLNSTTLSVLKMISDREINELRHHVNYFLQENFAWGRNQEVFVLPADRSGLQPRYCKQLEDLLKIRDEPSKTF